MRWSVWLFFILPLSRRLNSCLLCLFLFKICLVLEWPWFFVMHQKHVMYDILMVGNAVHARIILVHI